MRHLSIALGSLTLVACPAVASAAPTADLTLNLEGVISASCSIEQKSKSDPITLRDGPGSHDIDYRVNCNKPMAVKLTSERGGLQHDGYQNWPASPGFTGLIKYSAAFDVAIEGASSVTAQSDQMVAGVTGQTGVTPFEARARLHLSWTPEGTLYGGRYRDTITVRVFAEGS